jgi:hypothetical protein
VAEIPLFIYAERGPQIKGNSPTKQIGAFDLQVTQQHDLVLNLRSYTQYTQVTEVALHVGQRAKDFPSS